MNENQFPGAVNGTFAGSDCSGGMDTAPQRVVRFPAERIARAAPIGASRWQIWQGRLRELAGRLLCWLGVPGAIANAEIKDSLTGQSITVAVSAHYVRLSVDNRDYYFDRITGRFDGTGSIAP
jgi:hypothetical protein